MKYLVLMKVNQVLQILGVPVFFFIFSKLLRDVNVK